MNTVGSVLGWFALAAGCWIIVAAGADFVDQWRHRPRPLRDPDGKWRGRR